MPAKPKAKKAKTTAATRKAAATIDGPWHSTKDPPTYVYPNGTPLYGPSRSTMHPPTYVYRDGTPLPPGWVAYYSENSGDWFYFDSVTGSTQWDRPLPYRRDHQPEQMPHGPRFSENHQLTPIYQQIGNLEQDLTRLKEGVGKLHGHNVGSSPANRCIKQEPTESSHKTREAGRAGRTPHWNDYTADTRSDDSFHTAQEAPSPPKSRHGKEKIKIKMEPVD